MAPGITFRTDSEVSRLDAEEVWPVYEAVFKDQPDLMTWRAEVWDKHTERTAFRIARAYEDQRLVGFAYGFTGQRGQWWTDRALEVLPPDVGRAWLDGHFELVSIGVLAQVRGRGIGRALLRRVTAGVAHERWLLMTTSDPDDPARRMYDAEGWQVIGPGVGEGTVCMAKGTPRPPAI